MRRAYGSPAAFAGPAHARGVSTATATVHGPGALLQRGSRRSCRESQHQGVDTDRAWRSSFLAGLIATARFPLRQRHIGQLVVNVAGALAIAFTLVVNLARGEPIASLAAALAIAGVLYALWVAPGGLGASVTSLPKPNKHLIRWGPSPGSASADLNCRVAPGVCRSRWNASPTCAATGPAPTPTAPNAAHPTQCKSPTGGVSGQISGRPSNVS